MFNVAKGAMVFLFVCLLLLFSITVILLVPGTDLGLLHVLIIPKFLQWNLDLTNLHIAKSSV